ncbi:rhodanese-related sulfurtransferase [Advenella sp. RU8]|mgnify:CR=1 FL=1|uniref:rhodanese-related sulfurtransferase n=1 Tax=Advenella sp. RU8 TaxID=3399575 RepID=UPI003AAE7B5D
MTIHAYPVLSAATVREKLLARNEIALIDVREEDPYAQEHPLWASNFPLSRLELQAWRRIPRRDTTIVVYGEDELEDLAPRAAQILSGLGYTRVFILEGGLEGWRAAGGEIFRDVNVPSKSFGEWVEHHKDTPSLSAEEVKKRLESDTDTIVLDARRFDEYQTMNIPGSISVPGAELVLRARALAPNPSTPIIVNCAGRTRSIIGTQSLVNAGLPNPIAALRNGTIGWTLAGYELETGANRKFPDNIDRQALELAQADARRVADAAGVRHITIDSLPQLQEKGRTTYLIDVRTPEEYKNGHLAGFINVPGGQLVQETDHTAPVRGARIVLADLDGVRANMSASWLAQMGWETFVIEPADPEDFTVKGETSNPAPEPGKTQEISASQLQEILNADENENYLIFDFTTSVNYLKRHIPGARFALRSHIGRLVAAQPADKKFIFTCGSSQLARFAANDAQAHTSSPIFVLNGGTQAWIDAGLPLEHGPSHLASPAIDRYRRPYEGTDAPASAMQAYLDWEFGLVEQLNRDGTHFFNVL